MVKEEATKAASEGNWTALAGVAGVGLASAIGIVPLVIIGLVLLGIGLVFAIYLLPLVVGAAVAGFTYIIGKGAGLRGTPLLASVAVAGIGSIMAFMFTDVTLWGIGVSGMSNQASAQVFGIFEGFANTLRLLVALVILGFVLIGLFGIKAIGGGAGSAVAGVLGSVLAGAFIGDFMDIDMVSVSEAGAGFDSLSYAIIASLLIGIAIMVATAKMSE